MRVIGESEKNKMSLFQFRKNMNNYTTPKQIPVPGDYSIIDNLRAYVESVSVDRAGTFRVTYRYGGHQPRTRYYGNI